MGRRGYPPEFCRKVLDLVEAGRPIAGVAQALGISDQSIYTWRRQDRIDHGLEPGLTSAEKGELETELHATRRAMELVREVVPKKAVPGGQGDGRRSTLIRGCSSRLGRSPQRARDSGLVPSMGSVGDCYAMRRSRRSGHGCRSKS
jgi:transposase